jgi:hypothetical protein
LKIERPPQEAIARLGKAVDRSGRTSSIRLPQGFARDRINEKGDPPLAKLLRGGGELRIKVLLTVLMMATRAPHETRVSSSDLASMLNLSNPETAGARRVSKAFSDLEGDGLVRRDRKPGYVPSTLVLDLSTGEPDWNDRNLPPGYITLPSDLWRRGWIITLSGRALALLIVLRELTNGRKTAKGTYVDPIRKRQYGFSDDTWTKATKELRDAGLLDVEESVTSFRGEPRRRNLYTLHIDVIRQFDPGSFS